MKIIRQGSTRVRKPWEGRWICRTCDSVVEFEADDVDLIGDVMLSLIKAMCPVCDDDRTFDLLNGDNGEPGDYK